MPSTPLPALEPAVTPDTRRLHFSALTEAPLDVLIAGGGINGAGIARDLALRARASGHALRIGLVERRHFASGTSGRNSQLIHGGLRYLKQLEFRLVRESLRERGILLGLAPHLVEPLPFLMPFRGIIESVFYSSGLWLYDLLAGKRRIARFRTLRGAELRRLEPGLAREFHSAAVFYDARVHAARFVLANVFDAVRHGAFAVNYVHAESWEREGGGFRVSASDKLGGQRFVIQARRVVDATGPWNREGALRLVRGSHIVLPRLLASDHAMAHFDAAGRIVFFIPWGRAGELTLVGTTDVDHENGPDRVHISNEEIRYLLDTVKRAFPNAQTEPVAAYSSLRPLVRDGSDSPTAASREHRIWESPDGVLHIAGGKYTTYRAMSEEAVDRVMPSLGQPVATGENACPTVCHVTAGTPLGGNTREAVAALLGAVPRLARDHGLSEAEAASTVKNYGVESAALFSLLPAAAPDGLTRLEAARIAFAARHEMAARLPDLLFVSTYWGYERRWDASSLAPFAAALGRHLGWDEARADEEIRLALEISELH